MAKLESLGNELDQLARLVFPLLLLSLANSPLYDVSKYFTCLFFLFVEGGGQEMLLASLSAYFLS